VFHGREMHFENEVRMFGRKSETQRLREENNNNNNNKKFLSPNATIVCAFE